MKTNDCCSFLQGEMSGKMQGEMQGEMQECKTVRMQECRNAGMQYVKIHVMSKAECGVMHSCITLSVLLRCTNARMQERIRAMVQIKCNQQGEMLCHAFIYYTFLFSHVRVFDASRFRRAADAHASR